MKKLIIAVAMVLAVSVKAFAGPVVTVHFEIGRKSLNCDKFGICNPGIDVNWKLSTMQINDETHTLQVVIAKEMITGKEEYFNGNTVTFEEAVVLPADIQKALGATGRIGIEKGTYTLSRVKGGFQINVPLK